MATSIACKCTNFPPFYMKVDELEKRLGINVIIDIKTRISYKVDALQQNTKLTGDVSVVRHVETVILRGFLGVN